MRKLISAVILFAAAAGGALAQSIGDVTTTPLSAGRATLSLDFAQTDYELILYASNFGEPDTSRAYDFQITGTAASRPIPLRDRRLIEALSPHDQLALMLRAEESALARTAGKMTCAIAMR